MMSPKDASDGLRADDVERIEILRGPQSTLYGSEAIGGVISITTLQGRPGFHADVDGRAGSYDSHELRASADAELCYEVAMPFDVERDRVTDAILRLDPEGHAAVDWSEKKNKVK